ncbi:sensor histidine kinase [Lewinella sp. LCG006]|uniref:sensor histidine kinase n=1 Tax=Lewinella sp. LCG006 TaxID=3231911 RepID=UPI003461221C
MKSPYSSVFRNIFFLALSLGFNSLLPGQSTQPSFFHYTTENGLPSSECYEVIQDREGYIWISTDNGVSRFDGYEFKNYGTEEGLLDKTVLFMHEDHRGWIWMSTFSGNFYIHRADTIAAYEYNYLLQEHRNKYYLVREFAVDQQGTLYASLSNLGILSITSNGHSNLRGPALFSSLGAFLIENSALLFEELPPNTSEEKGDKINSYLRKQRLPFDLIRPNGRDTTLMIPVNILNNANKDLRDVHGHQFFPLANDQFLLEYIDYLLLINNDGNFSIHSPKLPSINSLAQLKNGRILLGLNAKSGLLLFKDLANVLDGKPEQTFFQGYTVSHLLEDNQGGIWVATLEDGIFYLPCIEVQILHNNYNNEIDQQLSQLAPYSKEDALAMFENGDLVTLSKDGSYSPFLAPDEKQGVEKITYHPDQKMFFLYPFFQFWNTHWNKLSHVRPNNIQAANLRIGQLKQDIVNRHQLWATEYQNRAVLLKLLMEDQEISIIQSLSLENKSRIRCLVQTSDHEMAIGDMNGLYFYDLQKKSTLHYPVTDSLNIRINELEVLPAGQIIAATHGKGLAIINQSKDHIRFLTMADGLNSNTITHLIVDPKGQIWTGSQNGANRITFQGDSITITTYSTAFGLPANNINDLDIWADQIAITTSKGVALLPLYDAKPTAPPANFLYEVYLNQSLLDLKQNPSLSYQDNTLRFVFYYLDFRYMGKLRYRYRLNPDQAWITTNSKELMLTSLNPGSYSMEIEVIIPGQSYRPHQEASFTIAPPFWQLAWVKTLALVIILGTGYMLVNAYIQRLRQQGEKAKMAKEIDALRQQAYRAQMNPHFIFNCMSTIQGMIIGGKTEQENAIKMISRFSLLIRSALEASHEEQVSLKDELDLLNNYLSLEKIRFHDSFDYEITLDSSLEPDWVQLPPMLVQPFVENAVLHGMEGKKEGGKISVNYQDRDDYLLVTISDNGPGISTTKAQKLQNKSIYRHKSLGITITQRRLEILNHPGYELQVEEPRDDNGKIIGTIIKLQLPIS